jgi:hypothetical protein
MKNDYYIFEYIVLITMENYKWMNDVDIFYNEVKKRYGKSIPKIKSSDFKKFVNQLIKDNENILLEKLIQIVKYSLAESNLNSCIILFGPWDCAIFDAPLYIIASQSNLNPCVNIFQPSVTIP